MKEEINKYTELHDEFIALLLRYYKDHDSFLRFQTNASAGRLRVDYLKINHLSQLLYRNVKLIAKLKKIEVKKKKELKGKQNDNNEPTT